MKTLKIKILAEIVCPGNPEDAVKDIRTQLRQLVDDEEKSGNIKLIMMRSDVEGE